MSGEKKCRVWIIDDDRSIRWVLEKALQQAQITTDSFIRGDQALSALSKRVPDAILCDIRMPGMDGLTFLKHIHEQYPEIPVIIMTAHSDLDSAVSAYEGGAFEYLPKPFDIDEAVAVTRRALAQHETALAETEQVKSESALATNIIGEAAAMQEVFRAIGRLSHSNINVLINGGSGTGKELVAQALHKHSPRRDQPFIALNVAAIPKDLIESELFGHEKGAFTGAANRRQGRFQQACGGTLFLDEIGDMSPEAQTRLLRVLANGEFYRVGGHTPVKVDVRIMAATHQNLEQLVLEGRFREDLFHRLNVIRIHIPPLADRREDIPRLARHFFCQAATDLDIEAKVLLPDTEAYLCQLPWPGNVRQLENLCRWLTVMASGRNVMIEDLPAELKADGSKKMVESDWSQVLQVWADSALARGQKNLLSEAMPVFERVMIQSALNYSGGRKRDAAELLGCGRNTLTRKLKELGLEEESTRVTNQ